MLSWLIIFSVSLCVRFVTVFFFGRFKKWAGSMLPSLFLI